MGHWHFFTFLLPMNVMKNAIILKYSHFLRRLSILVRYCLMFRNEIRGLVKLIYVLPAVIMSLDGIKETLPAELVRSQHQLPHCLPLDICPHQIVTPNFTASLKRFYFSTDIKKVFEPTYVASWKCFCMLTIL